jgi:hypothetical protein
MPLRIVSLIVVALATLLGCAPSDNSHSTNLVKPSPGATPNVGEIESPDVKIDAAMQAVASEFQRRLGYYNGKLLSLKLENGRVAANWSSQKCDWVKEEILDLAISINRGQIGVVNRIEVNRTCDSRVRVFTISGAKFNAYKTGKISDAQFLEGIK